jgi:hypothetical protein
VTIPAGANRCRCSASVAIVVWVDDIAALAVRNDHVTGACRQGLWEQPRQILGGDVRYPGGRAGETWDEDRYAADLRHNPAPSLAIGEVVIHVAGNTAAVSGRTRSDTQPYRHNRYPGTCERRGGHWLCAYGCVWPLPEQTGDTVGP